MIRSSCHYRRNGLPCGRAESGIAYQMGATTWRESQAMPTNPRKAEIEKSKAKRQKEATRVIPPKIPAPQAIAAHLAATTGSSKSESGLDFQEILADIQADAPEVISLIESLLPLIEKAPAKQ